MANTDPSVQALIERARDPSATLADRDAAFGEIVRRFQDLAFACACSHLRDPALAEDAAQDAFLLAWERLDQLRDPAAFPAWIRRLVRTQCHRRRRGMRLELLPEEEAQNLAAAADDAADVDAAGSAALVRFTLSQLAPPDRLVLILFYGSGRSQAEIAAWLQLPVTTVARRLAHAKRRLRRRTLEALADGLRTQRRLEGEPFVAEFSARLRCAGLEDASGIGTLAGRLGLERVPRLALTTPPCAYVVEDPASRTPVAYAAALRTIFRPIHDLHLAVSDDALKRHAGDVLLTQVVQDLAARDAIALRHRTSARHVALVEFLLSRGFQVIERAQDWRLEAAADRARAVPGTLAADWEFRGLEALSRDPSLFDAALELLSAAIADTPAGHAVLPLHPDTLRRVLRRQRDGVMAIADGTLQGLLAASADDIVPQAARLNIVAVRKEQRRRGLASALLTRLLARQHASAMRLVAPAAPDLAAWLTRNGFTRVADTLLLERLLRRTVPVTPDRLDEYVGRYVVDAMPDTPIEIERHDDALISKARDMRDLLLAASESEFFTRHHDGRGRFERDSAGRVARLVVNEGVRQFVAIRR